MCYAQRMKQYFLSKSKFIAGLQCPKRLWLKTHDPEVIEQKDLSTDLNIMSGNEIGEMARIQFPGEFIDYEDGLSSALEQTQRLVSDISVKTIHEATFKFDNVLVRVDLLERVGNKWNLTEVKGSTSVKPHHIPDAAIQAWVLTGAGLELNEVRLMHVNNQFIYQGDGNYQGLLISENITEQIAPWFSVINIKKQSMIEMLNEGMPEISMGDHCYDPYECEFCPFCMPDDLPEYPVSILPNLREPLRSQLAEKYSDVREIPETELSNANHLRVLQATRSGEEHLRPEELAPIKELGWPMYYLDFETIGLAVPRWKGTRPYMQVPFQWSCHIHHQDGRLEHAEFLDTSGDDPRRTCAEGLINTITGDGVILAYNAGFEKRVIRELAGSFPDISDQLLALNKRFVDLLPITRAAYYHPSQKGSWSIKAVLPALVPDLDYSQLEGVHHGGEAQEAWMAAIGADMALKKEIDNQLLAYCKLDTLAMVKIVESLLRKDESNE